MLASIGLDKAIKSQKQEPRMDGGPWEIFPRKSGGDAVDLEKSQVLRKCSEFDG